MHRTIQITVSPDATPWLVARLEDMEHVLGISLNRGASILPPGDIVVVHALNRGIDGVLKAAEAARAHGAVSVVTAEVASIIDPEHADAVDDDVDEAIWEEAETGLRHQGRVTTNFLILMALGGGIAAAGLVSEPTPQAIAFVAASVIAPAYEPLAKIPLGLGLTNWNVVRRGLVSAAVGYIMLVLGSALMFAAMRAGGDASAAKLLENPEVYAIAYPGTKEHLISACAAVAGMVMVLAYRRSVIAGPLIALVLLPAGALIGAGLVAGEPAIMVDGLQRLLIDVAYIVGLGTVIVLLKQATVHRRKPMV